MSSLILKSLFSKPILPIKLLRVSNNLPKPCLQNVRGYRARKPFWLGIAKSKMFRFHIPPVIPQEEHAEILRLYQVYRTSMESLMQYFKDQVEAQSTGHEVLEQRKEKAREYHANCIKENDLWNAEVAKIREARMAKDAIKREETITAKIVAYEKSHREFIDQLNESVKREKEASKTFITPENIDEAIELALSNFVDHNYCIDLEGNKYEGRYGKPPPKKKLGQDLSTSQDSNVSIEAKN